jgi:two-component system, NtrC family, sensor kinase
MAKVRRAAAEAARELAETRARLIEELEQKNRQLRLSYDELSATQAQLVQSAKMASLGELVAGIAHEINNPLAFAVGHVQTIERSLAAVQENLAREPAEAPSAQFQRAVDRARELRGGLARIQDLVLKLRTFSRLDEGERKRVNVRESVSSVLTILAHRLEGKIQVVTRFEGADTIDCYAGLFNQALMNLLVNAIDSMKDGGTISISTRVKDDSLLISIADTGCGIPHELRDRVFEPFYTTKDVGQGTGLGLTITYSIVRKHGGHIELCSNDGGGTNAIIRLPLHLNRGADIQPLA